MSKPQQAPISFRASEAEKAAIRQAAQQRGITAAEVIRAGLRAQGVPLER